MSSSSSVRIALVQMRSEKGALARNLDVTRGYMTEAAAQGAEIVCFPEASLTGYVDPTRYPDTLLTLESDEVRRFVALTRELDVTALAGTVEANPAHPQELPYITQLVAHDGGLLGVYRKCTIPNDEAHLFAPADVPVVFDHPKVTFSVAICADLDSPGVFADCAERGAKLVFECAAPGLYGEQATRDWEVGYRWWRGECETKLARYARENGIFIAVATQAGRTSDEDFPGGGYLFGPNGELLAATPGWREGALYVDMPLC